MAAGEIMDRKPLLIGGAVAGVALTLTGYAGAHLPFLLNAEFKEIFSRVDMSTLGVGVVVLHVATRLLVGFAAFTIFTLARAKFSFGTALMGAVALVWVLLDLPALVVFSDLGMLPAAGLAKVGAYGVLEIALALLAGQWAAGTLSAKSAS
jgi:hypothetical protein